MVGREGEGKEEQEGSSELHSDKFMEMESETCEYYTKFQQKLKTILKDV